MAFEKVNPDHPDKVADRIAGAIVDLAYKKAKTPKVAVEVLIGHGKCHIIVESSEEFKKAEVEKIVNRIAGKGIETDLQTVPQDKILSANQSKKIRCGDNGIFKGFPVSQEQRELTAIARRIHKKYKKDGKYILADNELTICQSNAKTKDIKKQYPTAIINPIGDWTGGTNVDSGATNRKLGSDMGDGVIGGGLHGKDLSKADVSVNIFAHMLAQIHNRPVELHCSIGDEVVGVFPYAVIVKEAEKYIKAVGGFEKFAEWGLIR